MLFRPPELFNVEPGTNIDERTDIWVSHYSSVSSIWKKIVLNS